MTYVIGKACVDVMDKSCVGGAANLGRVGLDTPLVAALPSKGW